MRAALSAWIVAVALGGAGCAAVSVRVAAVPAAGQDAARVEADTAACARAAEGGEHEDERYAGCMLARQYRVYVALPTVHEYTLQFDVESAQPREASEATQDLLDCRAAAFKAVGWDRATTAQKLAVGALWPVRLGVMAPKMAPMETAFTSCLGARGYAVRRWVPTR